jgi:hypothetical protein
MLISSIQDAKPVPAAIIKVSFKSAKALFTEVLIKFRGIGGQMS